MEVELRRVSTRLAALGPARLERTNSDGTTPSGLVRVLLQHLADAGADVEGQSRRPVPRLGAHALGDQLTVLVRDLLAATDDGAVLTDVHDRLVQLRRAL